MVIAFLPESLPRATIKANQEERRKSHERYLQLKKTMHSNPDYVPSIDDRYVLQLNEGSYLVLIRKHDVLWSCIMYGLYATVQGGQDAIYPVWLINSPENHGFSFTSSTTSLQKMRAMRNTTTDAAAAMIKWPGLYRGSSRAYSTHTTAAAYMGAADLCTIFFIARLRF